MLACALCPNARRQRQRREATFDIVLSYRVAADALLVERLYQGLSAKGMRVWYDTKSLLWGQRWEHGFVAGLRHSIVIVPVLSKKCLAPFTALGADSGCDNVLLEHSLALELKERSVVYSIAPLLVGEKDSPRSHTDDGRPPTHPPTRPDRRRRSRRPGDSYHASRQHGA